MLVTYWEHFWLNEGWTVWLERSIKAQMTSPAMFDFCALSGLQHLHDDLAHFGHDNALTALNPKLEGIDPDDAFSSVPYEKGFNFLVHLSTKVGAAGWADFVKAYISRFKFTTLTSADFRSFEKELSAGGGPGGPPNKAGGGQPDTTSRLGRSGERGSSSTEMILRTSS